jgi:predicted metal-dependent hydrolase
LPPWELILTEAELEKNLLFCRGIEEFNCGNYFSCHETLEELWMGLEGEAKIFVQGLIQVSVGLYHYQRSNTAGAAKLFKRARVRLVGFEPSYAGISVRQLIEDVDLFLRELKSSNLTLPLFALLKT